MTDEMTHVLPTKMALSRLEKANEGDKASIFQSGNEEGTDSGETFWFDSVLIYKPLDFGKL